MNFTEKKRIRCEIYSPKHFTSLETKDGFCVSSRTGGYEKSACAVTVHQFNRTEAITTKNKLPTSILL